jgi:hypothetical protein
MDKPEILEFLKEQRDSSYTIETAKKYQEVINLILNQPKR